MCSICVELYYSYLQLFQVCSAVYFWRKSIGKGAQTSAEFFQCEGKGSHCMFLFAIIPILNLKYTNFKISLYEAEGKGNHCVFPFFFNIPQYSLIFYNIQQYFILAKKFQCEAEGKRSHFYFHCIFTFTIQRNFCVINKGRHHLLCLFRKQLIYMLCFCAVVIRYMKENIKDSHLHLFHIC